MTTPAIVLHEAGLLDWPTAAFGFARRWMSAPEVETLAVNRLIAETDLAPEVVALTSSGLSEIDISEHLGALAQSSASIDDTVVLDRWLYANLVVLDKSMCGDETTRTRLNEIYAEFGYPEIIRYVAPHNIPPDGVTISALDCFHNALVQLRVELLEPGAG